MFADDTNLFFSKKPLLLKAHLELGKISELSRANKLCLHKDKARFTLFHRFQNRDNLPLKVLALKR